jgi:prevent-host-death family protein
MSKVSAFEAKTRFGELLDRVSAGEEIVITRHDRPIARIVPEAGPRNEDVARAVDDLRILQKEIAGYSQKRLSWKQIKSLVEEGRR